MNITIRQKEDLESPQTNFFSRKSLVTSRLVLGFENEKLVYSIKSVEPYERNIQAEDIDYGFTNAAPTIFFAENDGNLIGRIKIIRWWNHFAYIDDIVVNPAYRGKHIGRLLLERGMQWARENHYPGIMLETQDNNVPACSLYKNCGFVLSGFDRNVYKAMHPDKNETALYWYLIF